MSEHYWMPFNFEKYLGDTGHLSTIEHGAYFLLIAHYWQHRGLPTDEKILQRITRMSNRQWSKSLDVLRSLFLDGWRHKRIDKEIAKAIEKSRVNSANAQRRHSERTAKPMRSDTQLQLQSQLHKKERKRKPVAMPPEFEDFWNSVPKKAGRYEAIIAYRNAIEAGADPLKVNAAAKRWRTAEEKTEEKYIALPATWLNKRRFDDYHAPPERETNLEYDPETKEWRWKRGFEPETPERTN